MNTRFFAAVAAVAALGAVAAPAAAQNWQTINQRQANLDARIDTGVRRGDLTATEAYRLRAEFRTLSELERDYRRTGAGLDIRERAELDRRFDALSGRIYVNRNDAQAPAWTSINQRQANLDRRIDQGVRRGGLTPREAAGLRAEYRVLAQLEADYRRSGRGLDARERVELDRRFDALSGRIRDQRNDRQRG